MDIFELATHMGGESVGNEARIRRDGKWLTLGRIVGERVVLTPIGERLLAEANTPAPDLVIQSESNRPVSRRGRQRKPEVDVPDDTP